MKRLFRAFLWAVCWGGIFWAGVKAKLGFDILKSHHWRMLFDHSPNQVWPLDMAPKKTVCKVLLCFIVIGILGLGVALKRKKGRVPVVKGELPPETTLFRPPRIASQGRMAAISSPTTSTNSTRAPEQPAGPAVGTMAEAVQRIANASINFQLTVFPHVKLENTFTNLVLSDDTVALMLKILPQNGTWKVQENPDPAQSIWTLDEQEGKNELNDILESGKVLKRLEPEANVFCVVVLTNGDMQDSLNVRQYLTEKGIRIATLLPNNRTINGLQTLDELLGEFFEKKKIEGET